MFIDRKWDVHRQKLGYYSRTDIIQSTQRKKKSSEANITKVPQIPSLYEFQFSQNPTFITTSLRL